MVWIHISPQAQFDEKGRFMGSMALFRDITLQKDAEEKLREYSIRLENMVVVRDYGAEVLNKLGVVNILSGM